MAFIGLTSLMGIVINNSMLLVDEGNQLRRVTPDENLTEIAIRAGVNRFMLVYVPHIAVRASTVFTVKAEAWSGCHSHEELVGAVDIGGGRG
ncbi:MAG: multidrug efflux pump subunit AcrB [Candidatus Azotimanducaceae bacterium]